MTSTWDQPPLGPFPNACGQLSKFHSVNPIPSPTEGFVSPFVESATYFADHLESIRAASSDFEARHLLPQSARHRRQRAPGKVQCLSLHCSGTKPIPYRSQELISVPLIFCRIPCVINRSHIELNSQIIPNHDDFVASTAAHRQEHAVLDGGHRPPRQKNAIAAIGAIRDSRIAISQQTRVGDFCRASTTTCAVSGIRIESGISNSLNVAVASSPPFVGSLPLSGRPLAGAIRHEKPFYSLDTDTFRRRSESKSWPCRRRP